MKILLSITIILLVSALGCAQTNDSIQGPKLDHLAADFLPANSQGINPVITGEYGGRIFSSKNWIARMFGFNDFRIRPRRLTDPMTHTQTLFYNGARAGLMVEEGRGGQGWFVRLGPAANVNKIPVIDKAMKPAIKFFQVSWLLPAAGRINPEIKFVYETQSWEFENGKYGGLSSGGFVRWRYGAGTTVAQPQIRYQIPQTPVQIVTELSWTGWRLTPYIGARVDLLKLIKR